MTTHIGLWIDHRRAVIILDDAIGTAPTIIKSHAERNNPLADGEPSHPPRVADDVMERRHQHDLNAYYDEIATLVSGAASLLVIGPGEAKGEFVKRLAHVCPSPARRVEVETTDKLTDRQVAAKVRAHFAAALPL